MKHKTIWNRRKILLSLCGLGVSVTGITSAKAQNYQLGIILVGASWCPMCRQVAPLLHNISLELGIPVLVASADNQKISPFPEFVSAIGHPFTVDIKRFPTTLIFSNTHKKILGNIEGFKEQRWYFEQLTAALNHAQNGNYYNVSSSL